jgi:hypothetical protein
MYPIMVLPPVMVKIELIIFFIEMRGFFILANQLSLFCHSRIYKNLLN